MRIGRHASRRLAARDIAELLSGIRTEPLGGPGRTPHHVDGGISDSGQLLQTRFDLHADIDVERERLESGKGSEWSRDPFPPVAEEIGHAESAVAAGE